MVEAASGTMASTLSKPVRLLAERSGRPTGELSPTTARTVLKVAVAVGEIVEAHLMLGRPMTGPTVQRGFISRFP